MFVPPPSVRLLASLWKICAHGLFVFLEISKFTVGWKNLKSKEKKNNQLNKLKSSKNRVRCFKLNSCCRRLKNRIKRIAIDYTVYLAAFIYVHTTYIQQLFVNTQFLYLFAESCSKSMLLLLLTDFGQSNAFWMYKQLNVCLYVSSKLLLCLCIWRYIFWL